MIYKILNFLILVCVFLCGIAAGHFIQTKKHFVSFEETVASGFTFESDKDAQLYISGFDRGMILTTKNINEYVKDECLK